MDQYKYKARPLTTVLFEAFLIGCVIVFIGITVSILMGAELDFHRGYFWGMVGSLFITGVIYRLGSEYTKANFEYSKYYLKQMNTQ